MKHFWKALQFIWKFRNDFLSASIFIGGGLLALVSNSFWWQPISTWLIVFGLALLGSVVLAEMRMIWTRKRLYQTYSVHVFLVAFAEVVLLVTSINLLGNLGWIVIPVAILAFFVARMQIYTTERLSLLSDQSDPVWYQCFSDGIRTSWLSRWFAIVGSLLLAIALGQQLVFVSIKLSAWLLLMSLSILYTVIVLTNVIAGMALPAVQRYRFWLILAVISWSAIQAWIAEVYSTGAFGWVLLSQLLFCLAAFTLGLADYQLRFKNSGKLLVQELLEPFGISIRRI